MPLLYLTRLVAPLAFVLTHGIAPHVAPRSELPVAPLTYVWCEALTAPPLTRYVSRIFELPADTSINLPALFGAAVVAKHHPRPQELACDKRFASRAEADAARERRLQGTGAVIKMPIVAVEWQYEPTS